jgi:hypothetical protein
MLHMLQELYTYFASVYPQCFICFFYMYVTSFSDAYLKCFICFLLYVASVASGCFKSRSGYCTCCNGVSTVCPKCFICFRRMLQRFHLDLTKVDLVFECCSGTHLLRPPACSCWARVHACGSGRARAAGVGTSAGADRGMRGKRSDMGPHVKHVGMRWGARVGTAGASVRTLALGLEHVRCN